MTKREGHSPRACSEDNVLSANIGNCVLENIGNPLCLNVCKLTFLEYDSFESPP